MAIYLPEGEDRTEELTERGYRFDLIDDIRYVGAPTPVYSTYKEEEVEEVTESVLEDKSLDIIVQEAIKEVLLAKDPVLDPTIGLSVEEEEILDIITEEGKASVTELVEDLVEESDVTLEEVLEEIVKGQEEEGMDKGPPDRQAQQFSHTI